MPVDRRPPRAWWSRTVRALEQRGDVDDPEALAGWIWYHHRRTGNPVRPKDVRTMQLPTAAQPPMQLSWGPYPYYAPMPQPQFGFPPAETTIVRSPHQRAEAAVPSPPRKKRRATLATYRALRKALRVQLQSSDPDRRRRARKALRSVNAKIRQLRK